MESVDRLSSEIHCLRQVLDDMREDVSWLTRNGLPVQPIEHVHVRRMARDVNADDWSERLVIERTQLHPPGQHSAMGSLDVGRIAEELRTAVETLSHGQLLPVLNALDVVRAALLDAMQRQHGGFPRADPQASPTLSAPASPPPQKGSPPPNASPGRLF